MVRSAVACLASRSRSRLSFLSFVSLFGFGPLFLSRDFFSHRAEVHTESRIGEITSISRVCHAISFSAEMGTRGGGARLVRDASVCYIHLCTHIHSARCISNGKTTTSHYMRHWTFVYHERIKRGESPEELSRGRLFIRGRPLRRSRATRRTSRIGECKII